MSTAAQKNIHRAIRQGLRGVKTTQRGSVVRVANDYALRGVSATIKGVWTYEPLRDYIPEGWVIVLSPDGRGFFGFNPSPFKGMMG